MFAYYAEMPRILTSGSNFQFIPLVEFWEIFRMFSIFRTLVTICAYIYTYNLLNVFEDILYYTLSFTLF